MITFEKIRWKNFLSTGNQFTEINLALDSEAKYSKNSTTLIVGTNGAGKSTVLDALTFSLFNKPFRKISKGQLVNTCLLYTSPSPRDVEESRMPSSA